jgi:hypothetical protein
MASINATTSSGIVATADNTGQLQLQSAGTTVMTITSTGVTTQVGAPAFSAYKSAANQSLTSGVYTKVTFDTESFDTNNNFASSRFTPTVAGYYQINGRVDVETSGSITRVLIAIWKNGVESTRGGDMLAGNAVVVSDVVYCNGTTDYLEIYTYTTGTSLVARAQPYNMTYFSGCFLRSA